MLLEEKIGPYYKIGLSKQPKKLGQHISISYSGRGAVHTAINSPAYQALFGMPMVQHAASYEL